MGIINLLLLFLILPVLLILGIAALIHRRSEPPAADRRTFLFLAWTSLGLLAASLALNWLTPRMGTGFSVLLGPVLAGTLVLTLLNLRAWQSLRSGDRTAILTAIAVLSVVALIQFWVLKGKSGGSTPEWFLLAEAILIVSVLAALLWQAKSHFALRLGWITLIFLLAFNVLEGGGLPFFDSTAPWWLEVFTGILYVILTGLTISTIAVLTWAAMQPGQPDGLAAFPRYSRALALLLALALLGTYMYTIVWLSIWDGTDDGIRALLILVLSIVAATAGGMVLATISTGWRRWSGLFFTALVIGAVLWTIRYPGNDYHPYPITEARAAQLQQAIQHYRDRTGSYPVNLSSLVPLELLRVSRPMIMTSQGWCYESGPDFYRLGTIYREHWSAPDLSVRVYASAGAVPDSQWICDERLSRLKQSRSIGD